MRKILLAVCLAVAALGVTVPAVAASATVKPKCAVVHDHITKTDTGHGTPAAWADLSLNRTTTICGSHVTLIDVGTLWTRTGAGSPNGTGTPIAHRVPGKVHGVYSLTVSGGTLAHFHGDVSLSSTEYVKSLFTEGTVVTGGKYAWLYTTCREKWLDSSANSDGQGAAAGNITGKICFHKPVHHPKPRPCVTPSATPLHTTNGWHPTPKPCPPTGTPTPTPTVPDGSDNPPGEAPPAVPVTGQPHFTG